MLDCLGFFAATTPSPTGSPATRRRRMAGNFAKLPEQLRRL